MNLKENEEWYLGKSGGRTEKGEMQLKYSGQRFLWNSLVMSLGSALFFYEMLIAFL